MEKSQQSLTSFRCHSLDSRAKHLFDVTIRSTFRRQSIFTSSSSGSSSGASSSTHSFIQLISPFIIHMNLNSKILNQSIGPTYANSSNNITHQQLSSSIHQHHPKKSSSDSDYAIALWLGNVRHSIFCNTICSITSLLHLCANRLQHTQSSRHPPLGFAAAIDMGKRGNPSNSFQQLAWWTWWYPSSSFIMQRTNTRTLR